jgi:hypothetical protein
MTVLRASRRAADFAGSAPQHDDLFLRASTEAVILRRLAKRGLEGRTPSIQRLR